VFLESRADMLGRSACPDDFCEVACSKCQDCCVDRTVIEAVKAATHDPKLKPTKATRWWPHFFNQATVAEVSRTERWIDRIVSSRLALTKRFAMLSPGAVRVP
jgi:hypothetical protein